MHATIKTRRLILLLLVLSWGSLSALAQDWAQWRGPQRDGIATTFKNPKEWPDTLTLKWKVPVGEGHSSPVLVGNRVYLLARQDEQEVVASYDLKSGKQLWRHSYVADYMVHEAATVYGKAPRATPLVHNGRVYTLGVSGRITCLEARTGKLLWKKETSANGPQGYPLFGFAPSPLFVDGLVIIATGGERQSGLSAFNAETGEEKWKWIGEYHTPHDGVGYSSPVLMKNAGETHLVVMIDTGLFGLAPQSGQVLWKSPLAHPYECVPTPVIHGNQIIVSEQKAGLIAVRLNKRGNEWEATQVWQNPEFFNYMSSPVAQGSLLFGMSRRNKGQYFCVDLLTGQSLWRTEGRQGESAAVLLSGNGLFIQNTDGELIVARTSRAKFDVVRRYKIADSATWAHPVLFDRHLLVKDANSLLLWGLS